MFILKVALLSCALYLAFALLSEVAIYAVALRKGSFGVVFTSWGWVLWSGVFWLVSTSLAYRILMSGVRATIQ